MGIEGEALNPRLFPGLENEWSFSGGILELHGTDDSFFSLFFSLLKWECVSLFFFKILFIYHERHRERQRHRKREKQAPCEEPDVGLNPRILGSRPEPKADTQPLSHPGAPRLISLNANSCLLYTSPSPRDATLSRMPSSA